MKKTGRPKIVSIMEPKMYRAIMDEGSIDRLKSFADYETNFKWKESSEEEKMKILRDADGCLSTWGGKLSPEIIEGAKNLKIIGYAAGSVKSVIPRLAYERGIVIVNSGRIIAKSVGEMALGMAIAGLRAFSSHDYAFKTLGTSGDRELLQSPKGNLGNSFGLYGSTVGIIGASATGREFIKLLSVFGSEVKILVYDPYLSGERAEELGVKPVELEELLSSSDVVSLHAPLTEETEKMMGKREFALMKDNAVFVNTARGRLVDHDALYNELKRGRIRACLDVYLETCKEPVSSLYRGLTNVLITPGLAGPTAQVLNLMGKVMVDDMETFFSGGELPHRITLEQLATMA